MPCSSIPVKTLKNSWYNWLIGFITLNSGHLAGPIWLLRMLNPSLSHAARIRVVAKGCRTFGETCCPEGSVSAENDASRFQGIESKTIRLVRL